MARQRFSKQRILSYLKRKEQEAAREADKPCTEKTRQYFLIKQSLCHDIIVDVNYNRLG